PDRHFLAGERVHRLAAGVEPFLLYRSVAARLPIERTELRDAVAERGWIGTFGRELIHHRMLGREQDESRSEDRVDPRGEDLDVAAGLTGDGELDAGALGAADPVLL